MPTNPVPTNPVPTNPVPEPTRGRFRADIQGLRAVAVTMVLLYHAGVPFVPGGFAGVDVFFVISGFLITGLMVRELERTGRLSLRNFWARRAKRLLPATAVVLVAVTVLSLFLLPQLRWSGTAGDIVASALYVINWRLAAQSLDYLAQGYAPSPVQHFWSLAVEEQFYLIWPVLVLLIATLARRFGWPLRRTLTVGLVLLAVPSLLWSIHLGVDPSAYFVTTTRVWELAVGAAVSLLAVRLVGLNPRVGAVLSWGGVLVLLATTVLLPDTVPWPGRAALIPTLGTAAVLAGGPVAGSAGATYLLGRAPIRWVGDLSYSLYLWHWPLVVFATLRWTHLGPARGLLVVLASFVPAYLTYRLVESPIHLSVRLARFPIRALALGAACTVVAVAAGGLLRVAIPHVQVVPLADRPGAGALRGSLLSAMPDRTASSITPDPLVARDDLPDLYGRGCQTGYQVGVPTPCVFGDPASPVTVALVGDSRAAEWSPALQEVGRRQGWRIVTITKAGCPFAQVLIFKGAKGRARPYTTCTEWNASVMRLLSAGPDRPSFVLTSDFSPYLTSVGGQLQTGEASRQTMIKGIRASWVALNQIGIPVVALRETPMMSMDVVECVSTHRQHLDACAALRRNAMSHAHTLQPAAEGLTSSTTVDLTLSSVCPTRMCPAVIGNVLVYRDEHHLTATYSRTLAPALSAALAGLRRADFAAGVLNPILPAD
jgi:peptidoglycan/LPS O-acetylase OafA/YrhL